jgi:lysophospholipase L1-like esterase
MYTILCYGDSNTWGFDPESKRRLGHSVRWTGVLQLQLADGYGVIDEGLNGRTTVWSDPLAEYRNGKLLITPILETHKPLDLVILMLGTNDCKRQFAASAYDIARGIAVLIGIIRKSGTGPNDGVPEVLLVCPPPIGKLSEFAETFEGAEEKSRKLAAYYRGVSIEHGCHFFDAGGVVSTSDIDGVHLDPAEHSKLGAALADQVRRILAGPGRR